MDPQSLLITAIKATIVYFFLLIVVRILGKREVGATTAFDFIVALILGEVVDEIIFSDVSMLKGIIAISVIAIWHLLNSWASYKSKTVEKMTASTPTVLVEHGKMVHSAMAKERMSEDELWSELRIMSINDLTEVKKATLETNGQVSVIKEDWAKELQKGDLPKAKAEPVKGG